MLFTLFCFSTSYIYGYFLEQQQQYYNMVTNQISYDINHNQQFKNNKYLIATNALPLFLINKRLIERVPFLKIIYNNERLSLATPKLSHTFDNTYMGGYEGIADLTKELKDSKNQAVIENKNYDLFSYKGNTFIYFNP